MKINLVIDTFYPNVGGQQVRFYELLEKFIEAGHEIQVFTVAHSKELQRREKLPNGIIVNRIIRDGNYYKNGVFGRRLSTYLKFSWRAIGFLKKNPTDMVIFDQFSFLTAIFFKSRRATTIVDFVEFRKSIIWKLINLKLLRTTNKIVCISKYLKTEVDAYLDNTSRTVVIPSLVKTEKYFAKAFKDDFILFLGRLEPHKNPDQAIFAVDQYNRKMGANLRIKIAGGGSLLQKLKSEYAHHTNVEFMGYIEDDFKYELLSNAKCLILPSEREGLPKSFIEAISSRLPILTVDYPENYGRFFVEDNGVGKVAKDKEDLADCLEEVFDNSDYFIKNCEKIISKYDLSMGAKTYLKIDKN